MNRKILFPTIILGSISVALGFVLTVLFFRSNQNNIYPGIYIDNTYVGELSKDEAIDLLVKQQQPNETYDFVLSYQDQKISSTSAQLGLHKNISLAIDQAFEIGKNGSWYQRLNKTIELAISPEKVETTYSYEKDQLLEMISHFAEQVYLEGHQPFATLAITGNHDSLDIDPGEIGQELDTQATLDKIQTSAKNQEKEVEATINQTYTELSSEEIESAYQRASTYVGYEFSLTHEYQEFIFNDQDIIDLLAFPTGIDETKLAQHIEDIKIKVNREPQDAVFEYDPETMKVQAFLPHKDGIKLDEEETKKLIEVKVSEIQSDKDTESQRDKEIEADSSQPIPTTNTKPTKDLSQTNDLGINEQIGFGESNYDHSIPSRINNVSVTTNRISNTLVAPGEEFSFNQTLGEVSSRTGYQPAYVISGGMTVLGDGGGVCQVSSTLFRALLDAGLKITRRLPHSYRVSYYELNSDPGFDATVYSGNVDLRFINDTDNYILIHGEADSAALHMFVEIYGTSDGRTTEIVDYKKWGYSPPAPTQYFPDPSLAPGQLKQIDWAASGIKAEFTHIIRDKDGNITSEKTYTSNYRPWSAKYLRGV